MQLPLPLPAEMPPQLNVFLGLRPPALIAIQAEETARQLVRRNRLGCRPRPAHVLHVSLHGLKNCRMRAAAFEFGAIRAVAGLSAQAFDICFDRAVSLDARSGFNSDQFPVVLLADADSRSRTVELWEDLGWLLKQSIGKRASQIEPHMTVAYDHSRISEQSIRPLRWRVNEVVLVRSFVGETRHLVVHRQPLRRLN